MSSNSKALDKYLYNPKQSPPSELAESINKIISEKNSLIEKYRGVIDDQKNENSRLKEKLSQLTKENMEMKLKLEKIESSSVSKVMDYYEKQIEKISKDSISEIKTYKEQIKILMSTENDSQTFFETNRSYNHTVSNTSFNQSQYKVNSPKRLKSVIENLMKDNSKLKLRNAELSKYNRKDETYKFLMMPLEKKETNKSLDQNKMEQIKNIDSLAQEIARLKEELNRKEATILDLTNALNSITIHNTGIIPSESKKKIIEVSKKISTKSDEEDTKTNTMITLNLVQLDKYLNSTKIFLNEKISEAVKIMQEINEKNQKTNSIYKKLISNKIKGIQNEFNQMLVEINTLIIKSNSAFNKCKLGKKLLSEVVVQYQQINYLQSKAQLHKRADTKEYNLDESLIKYITNFLVNF